jgi:glucose-6-phosphate isomerase
MSDVTFDMTSNQMKVHHKKAESWRVTLVDTGEETLTGGRLKRVADYVCNDDVFCFTYGDGVADINIKELIKGCQDMRDQFLSTTIEKNLPFQIATIQSLLYEKGKTINVMMPYAQKLARFADWYRQLLAESIGKAKNTSGETVNVGITPINALGATDQHSQSQLYNEGPNDKVFMFLKVRQLGKTIRIPNPYPKDESVHFLKNTSFNELINVAQEGTAAAYTDNERPNITIEIDRIDAYHLGQLFMLFEGATAFLGEYFSINAFDQPGVELAKIKTKELLLKKHTV